MFEGLAWIINEITGGHPAPATVEFWENVEEFQRITGQAPAISDTIGDTPELDAKLLATLAPITEAAISDTVDEIASLLFPTTQNEQWIDYVRTLTVKQLQTLVGTKNSRLRKADLIALAIG